MLAICKQTHSATIEDYDKIITVQFKKNIIYEYFLDLGGSFARLTHPDYKIKLVNYDIKDFKYLFSEGIENIKID